MAITPLSTEVHGLNASWLARLRWLAFAAQAALIAISAAVLDVELPLLGLGVIVGVGAISNAAFARHNRRQPVTSEALLAAIIAADLVLLSALLYLTGGPFNPFSAAYLVQVVLAVTMLRPRWAWALTIVAVALFGLLFPFHRPLPNEPPPPISQDAPASAHHHHMGAAQNDSGSATMAEPPVTHEEMMMGHLYGMWLAFGLTAVFIVYFVYEIRAALSRREEELASAQQRGARTEKLIALGTLSAGAAHELATPLSTIAVVAKELELGLQRRTKGSETVRNDINTLEDVQLIRSQVDRCRDILGHMSAAAGDTPGETMENVLLADLVAEATQPFMDDSRLQINIDTGEIVVPRSAFTRAIRSLVANALMASESDSPVSVTGEFKGGQFELVVTDRGCGMSGTVLERATEPFFTTRSPGQGMGLGLFLARAVAESMGGRLDMSSEAGQGTTARLSGPIEGT